MHFVVQLVVISHLQMHWVWLMLFVF